MERIIRSLAPTVLLVAGVVVFVLGTAFTLASDASLASSSLGASSDLAQAGHWFQFVAWLCILGAVCSAGWDAILNSEWIAAAEIAAAALGALLFAIGAAALAASNDSSASAAATGGVGIGIWALLVLSRAARVSLAEQGPAQGTPPVRRADLWLGAALGLFALAIGYGLSSASDNSGTAVFAGVLEAIGVGALAWAVTVARSRNLLEASPVRPALAGLALLAVSFLASAIVAGLSFGSFAALGTSLTIVTAVELAAVVALGLSAWTRVRELYRQHPEAKLGTAFFSRPR